MKRRITKAHSRLRVGFFASYTNPENPPGSEFPVVTEYVCLTLLANAGESEAGFKARLAAFWTHLLRNRKADYERVYAEASRFGVSDGRVSRQYMVEVDVVDVVTAELSATGIAFSAVDPDDTYTKYEATSPDWFQIPH